MGRRLFSSCFKGMDKVNGLRARDRGVEPSRPSYGESPSIPSAKGGRQRI